MSKLFRALKARTRKNSQPSHVEFKNEILHVFSGYDDLSLTQEYILSTLIKPRTDEEIKLAYSHFKFAPDLADTTLRTARADLVKRGYVRDSGSVKLTPRNRAAIIWEATNVDR